MKVHELILKLSHMPSHADVVFEWLEYEDLGPAKELELELKQVVLKRHNCVVLETE